MHFQWPAEGLVTHTHIVYSTLRLGRSAGKIVGKASQADAEAKAERNKNK